MHDRKPWLRLAAVLLALAAPAGAVDIPVSGRVETEGGRPLPGAAVRLLPLRTAHQSGIDELAGRVDAEPVAEAFTDDDGRFELPAPAAGLWQVRASAEGHTSMVAWLRPLLERTSLPSVELRPSHPLTVTVLDPAGEPLAGAAVTASTRSPGIWRSSFGRRGSWSRAPGRAVSDAEGRATLERAAGEKLRVAAGTPGFVAAEPVETVADRLELRLRSGRAVTIEVRDAADRPQPGVLVMAGKGSWSAGLTGDDGRVEATLGEPGVVRAVSRTGARAHVTAAAEAEAVSLVLNEPTRLAGRVIDAESRQAVAGALVWSRRATAGMARTDAAGRFDLFAERRGGLFWVKAAAPGYFGEQLQVSEAQEFEPVIALEPAAAATGEVVADDGEPIAGAEITASFVPDSPASFRRGAEAHTSSGEEGRFRFSDLTPDIPLRLEAVASGYAPASLDLEAIEARQTRAGLRLVLSRGVSLTGRVTGGGEPLAGAELTAVRLPQGSSPMVLFARRRQLREESETSDGQGAFEYRNLRAGTYQLTVSAAGFASLLVPGIEVAAGGADLGTLELEPGVEITGLVVDAEGSPIEGAEVWASGQGSQLFDMTGRRGGEPQAVTGADGSFTVRDRRSGERVDLRVTHSEHQQASAPGVVAPNPQPLRIVLQAGARLSGTVLDATGAPVAGATVAVMVEEADVEPSGMGIRGFRFPVRNETDDTGRFELEQVPSGKLRLSASAQGWRTAELSALEVPAGGELEDLRLVLERGATVSGRVFDADGQPAAGVWVRVEEDRTGMRFSQPASATTSGDGQYLLEGVEPGTRLIMARNEDRETTAQEIEVGSGVNRLDLRFATGASISGRVVDGAGAPLAGASVMALTDARSWGGAEARSGADGAFTIEGVRDGQYQLRATREGYATRIQEETVQVAGGSISGVEIVMSPGGTISGAIFGLEESQIPLINIFASGGPAQWSIGQTSHDGTYRIADLAPGEWNVQAMVPEGPKAQGRVTLAAGQSEATLDLDFTSGVVLSGQVLRSGQPVGGLMVQLRGIDVAGWSSGRTDHEGRFRLEGLEPGRHRLEVADFRSDLRHREEIELAGDRDLVVEIFTGRVAGRVLDADDLSPLAGAEIRIELAEEDPGAVSFRRWTGNATTDDQGRFVIPKVSAADYRFKFVRQGYAPAERMVTVVPDGDLADLEVMLQPTSGLRLRVRGASGAPVAEVVYAILDDGGRALDSGRRQADENGQVRLGSAPAGSWDLLVAAPGAAVQRKRVEVPGPLVELALEPSCRLEVKVAALADAGAATMRITGTDGVPFVSVEWGHARHEWELYLGRQNVSGLPAGGYNVEVTTPDGESWQGTVTVAPGAMTRLDL